MSGVLWEFGMIGQFNLAFVDRYPRELTTSEWSRAIHRDEEAMGAHRALFLHLRRLEEQSPQPDPLTMKLLTAKALS